MIEDKKQVSLLEAYSVAFFCFVFVTGFALLFGEVRISPSELIAIVAAGPNGMIDNAFKLYTFWHLRFPRVIISLMGGAAFAGAGLAMRAATGRASASPFTLAVSPGAAFGAACCTLVGLRYIFEASLIGAISGLIMTLTIGELAREKHPRAPLISGIAIALLMSAGTFALNCVIDEDTTIASIFLAGDFADAAWWDILPLSISFCLFLFICSFNAQELEMLLSPGEGFMRGAVSKIRIAILLCATCQLIACIAGRFGVFALFGLVVPNYVADYISPRRDHFLSLSILWGATAMCAIDTISRISDPMTSGFWTLLLGLPTLIAIAKDETRISGE